MLEFISRSMNLYAGIILGSLSAGRHAQSVQAAPLVRALILRPVLKRGDGSTDRHLDSDTVWPEIATPTRGGGMLALY